MTSAISGVGGGSWAMQRPDTSKMVNNLFSKIDTKNQGYIDKEGLQTAIDKIAILGESATSTSSAAVDEIFKAFDSDGDGKLSKQEVTSGFDKLADQLDSQFNQSRVSMGMGAMPRMDAGSDGGFTKDQLTSMASEIGSKNSDMSSRMTNLVNNFDQADSNSDGKISGQEAMSFDKTSESGSSNSAFSASGAHRAPPPGGMPPPPPGGAGESGSNGTDSTNSSTDTTYAAADTNKDGTVSFQEMVAYASKSVTDTSSASQTDTKSNSVMTMMIQLLRAYGGAEQDNANGISVTA